MRAFFLSTNTRTMLQDTFTSLLARYTSDRLLTTTLWQEVAQAYNAKGRRYHTLAHLENLLVHLQPVQQDIKNWDTMLFTLYYHDIVYNASGSDNEEKSAEKAIHDMRLAQVPESMTMACAAQIHATKTHQPGADTDTDYFTDADLCIFGQDPDTYLNYSRQVRKEYAIYPDLLYKPGRRKVLQHFLKMEHLFKTPYFSARFEAQARLNLARELETL